MKRLSSLLLMALAVSSSACAPRAVKDDCPAGAPVVKASGAPRQPEVKFSEFKLENGLKVIISERHAAPVVAVAVTYNVGARNEKAGKTGYAHLFEHMMFQGSENVGKAEHFILINNNGGSMNGSTGFDRTNYFQTLPSNQLELGLFLEADRMRSLDVSQENLDNQRNAVQEERRQRYDNRPYGTVMERLVKLTYDNPAYSHVPIGSMEDLNAATLEDIREFFRLYYAPNNAVLVLVGDVQTDKALELVKKHFGAIKSQPTPPLPDLSEKINKGERRDTFKDPLAPMPRLDMMFPVAPGGHPDTYPLELIAQILGGGDSSRLHQLLVKEKGLANQTMAYVMENRGAFALWLNVSIRAEADPAEVERLVLQEISRLQTEPVPAEELKRCQTRLRSQLIDWLGTSDFTAIGLGEAAVLYDRPNLVNEWPGLYGAVTVGDVQRVATTYLNATNRNVLVTLPGRVMPAAPAGK